MAPKRKPSEKVLIAFNLSPANAEQLNALARAHGFGSASLAARAILLESMGKPETEIALTRIAELRQEVQALVIGRVDDLFRNLTTDDLIK